MPVMYGTFEKCMATVNRCKMKNKNLTKRLFSRYDLEFNRVEFNVEIFKLTLYK